MAFCDRTLTSTDTVAITRQLRVGVSAGGGCVVTQESEKFSKVFVVWSAHGLRLNRAWNA
jgi:hypothetical protein